MRFGELVGVRSDDRRDWFDPVLSTDTRLFVDPFRIYVDDDPAWSDAHDELVEFFNEALKLVARSNFDESSSHWHAAERAFMFPEPVEFCLGYGLTPFGRGSADELRALIMRGAVKAIRAGVEQIHHIEELTLFADGFGPDRISDVVCNVLKDRFVSYTQTIVDEVKAGKWSKPVGVRHARWSRTPLAWADLEVDLPVNPFTNRGVLLVPKRFLRSLPSIGPEEFWDWAWTSYSSEIRQKFNYDLGKNVDADEIVRLAADRPDIARDYVDNAQAKPPYDFDADPEGKVSWYDDGERLADRLPDELKAPGKSREFEAFVGSIVDDFRHAVEDQDAWRLLWGPKRPRAEKYVQSLFRTIVVVLARRLDFDVSAEPNAGRGPVDFKFSKGWESRALVEVKLMNSSKFWHGLMKQTPKYLKAERVDCGYLLCVAFRESDLDPERKALIREAARHVSVREKIKLTPVFVDATPKRSASRS